MPGGNLCLPFGVGDVGKQCVGQEHILNKQWRTTIKLDVSPVDGRIVLTEPKADTAPADAAAGTVTCDD